MKTLKTTLIATALIISAQFSFAQSSAMKNPVSYTLKNGTTIIIAENESTPKVFANLSFEAAGQYTAAQATVQEVVTTLLNQQLTALDAGLSYSDKGVNLTTPRDQFEATLQTLYTYINAAAFDQTALAKAKAEVMGHLIAQDKYYPAAIHKSSLNQLSLSEVNAYYLEMTKAGQTTLTIAGNITPATAKRFAKNAVDLQKPIVEDMSKTYLVSNN